MLSTSIFRRSCVGVMWLLLIPCSLDVSMVYAQSVKINTTAAYNNVLKEIAADHVDEAYQLLTDALKGSPSDPQLLLLKAACLEKMNKTDEAKEIYLDLINNVPEFAEPYNNLATIFAKRGDINLAERYLKDAVRIDSNLVVAQENLAKVYVRLALQTFETLQKLQPNNTLEPQQILLLRQVYKTESTEKKPVQ